MRAFWIYILVKMNKSSSELVLWNSGYTFQKREIGNHVAEGRDRRLSQEIGSRQRKQDMEKR